MAQRCSSSILLLITAPSGAGKTTVSRNLLRATPGLERAVTCTTRSPRGGERDGVDYHFLDRATFEARVAAGEFLEHAEVYGNGYGTLKAEVIARLGRGADVLLSVDVQGADSIRRVALSDSQMGTSLVSVFLMPSSLGELERRLRGRNEDAPEVIRRRLEVARQEIAHWRGCDYVVVSGTEREDLAAMQGILAAEKLRSHRIRRMEIEEG